MKMIGILGNGQLARYLVVAGKRLGYTVACWPSDPRSPAGLVGGTPIDASLELREWLDACDWITFENEFLTPEMTDALERVQPQAKIFPPLDQITRLKNKLEQKILLQEAGAPVPDFALTATSAEAAQALRFGRVLKWAELGYDGKGVLLPTVDANLLPAFWNAAQTKRVVVFAEDRIDWDVEVAQLVVRSLNGEIKLYPLCRTEQRNGICASVRVPATEFGITAEIAADICACATRIVEHLEYVGCLAVECFVKGDQFWVNELAPRVHNSGHFSLDADLTDQFENHLRAGMGLALGTTDFSQWSGMKNLLGRKQCDAVTPSAPTVGTLHWYEKEKETIGRKLGHVNWNALTREKFERDEQTLEKWMKEQGYA